MVESMKILHIIAGAARGGAESCAVDTIKALHAAGIEPVSYTHLTLPTT